jgi:hypothetical protein
MRTIVRPLARHTTRRATPPRGAPPGPYPLDVVEILPLA